MQCNGRKETLQRPHPFRLSDPGWVHLVTYFEATELVFRHINDKQLSRGFPGWMEEVSRFVVGAWW